MDAQRLEAPAGAPAPIDDPSSDGSSDGSTDAGLDAGIAELARVKRRATMRALAFVVIGGLLGVAYHYTIGCSTGACALTATPERSAAYGMVVGLVVAML
jgi:hypothetical protein